MSKILDTVFRPICKSIIRPFDTFIEVPELIGLSLGTLLNDEKSF
mgnify:CR=1 FL=1